MCKPGCPACSPAAKGAYFTAGVAGLVIAVAAERALTAVEALSPVFVQLTCGVFVFAAVGVLAVARVLAGAPALAGVRAVGARTTWRAYQVTRARVRQRAPARLPVAMRQRLTAGSSRQGVGGSVSPAMLSAGLPAAQAPRSDMPATAPDNMPDNNPARQPVAPSIRVTTGPYRPGQADSIVVVVDDETGTLGEVDLADLVAGLAVMGRHARRG